MREYIQLVNGDVLDVFAKPRIKPYSEDEALKQAQQRYYQKKHRREIKQVVICFLFITNRTKAD